MARQGRFGRSETGASDLSATIRSLVSQQLASEEQMLFKAFYEGTAFGGSIPSYADLVKFVNERLGQGGASDAQVAYYDALLNQAQEFQTQNTYNDLKSGFYSSNGSNYEEFASFLQGEGSKFQDELYGVTKDYVTKFLYNDLATDQITEDEFMSLSQGALGRFVDDPFVYDDVKYDVYSSLYEYQLGEQNDILARVNPSNDSKVLKANEGLLAFYRGWRAKLNENGIAGDFLDTIQNNIAKTKFAVQDQRRVIADKAATALLNSRESAYNNAKAVVDEYARLLAPGLGIDASDPNFNFQDIPAVTLAAALDDLSPDVQSQIRTAIGDLRGKSDAYAQTLRLQGNVAEARSIRDISTDAKLVSGQDVSFEQYVKQSELKDALMAAADGIPSDEIAITKEWVRFLRGETTASFGAGIKPSADRAGQEVSLNIQNEANALDAAINGKTVGIIPKTYMDDFQAAQRAQAGLSGGAKDFYEKEFTGDNKYTAAELSNLSISLDLDKQISSGQTVISRKRNTDGSYATDYIPAGVPAPSAGVIYKIEQAASGKIVTVAYKGTPIYGAIAGNLDTSKPWGFAYETKGGTLYADAKDGKVYINPPIDVASIKRSGATDALITSDINVQKDQNGYTTITGIRPSGSGTQASLSDFVDPGALKSLESPGINPYAAISPSDPRVTDALGIVSNLKNIALGIPDSTTGKSDMTLAIGKIESNLNALSGRTSDAGVRIAQMNADMARQQAESAKANIAAVKPSTPAQRGVINPFSPVQPGGGEKFGGAMDFSVVFRELGKLAAGIGAGAIQAGGALAYGLTSAAGGALSAGINTILPGIPGAYGPGATSLGPRPLNPTPQVSPLAIRPFAKGTPRTTSTSALTLSSQPFVDFRAGERASLTSKPISTSRTTTTPRPLTTPGGRIAL
jgi:hypothetical protein